MTSPWAGMGGLAGGTTLFVAGALAGCPNPAAAGPAGRVDLSPGGNGSIITVRANDNGAGGGGAGPAELWCRVVSSE